MKYPHGRPNDTGTTHQICAARLNKPLIREYLGCCTCEGHGCGSDMNATSLFVSKPKGYRNGQTIMAFLFYCHGVVGEIGEFKPYDEPLIPSKMADVFNVPDDELAKIYTEFLKSHAHSPRQS